MKIYVASKICHAEVWRKLRELGAEIISTWIDETEINNSELASKYIEEVKSADILVLYCEPNDILKGTLIEVGAALATGKEVRCVGWCMHFKSLYEKHPLWKKYDSLATAVNLP